MSITGLVSDGRHLARFIRTECMNHRYLQDAPLPILRMGELLGDKHQGHINNASKRPFGVGLLIAGFDRLGPHLVQTSPSGDVYHFKATAMGIRSQSARTYLEKYYTTFADSSLDELVNHALKALASTCHENVALNAKNTTIAIVGVDTPFAIYSDESARKFLDGFVMRPEDIVAAAEDDEEGGQEVPVDADE